MVRLLLDNGAKINDPGFSREPPIVEAVKTNRPDCVKILLENQANYEGNIPNRPQVMIQIVIF